MRLVPSVAWSIEGEASSALDLRVLPLLHAIADTGSLTAAVARCGISYRAGWGLLRDYQRELGAPLVMLERGRGAHVTSTGQRLLDAEKSAARRLAPILRRLVVEIGTPPRKGRPARSTALRIAASHDIALAALSAAMPSGSELDLEVSFMGSLIALHEFVEGRADAAGFHIPIAGPTALDRSLFLRGLSARRDRLLRFVDRDQGLILPRGNPAKVKDLRDVAAQGLQFINRQRGSATRLLIDQMLADQKIGTRKIAGYAKEEFTHRAVAATVASGGAEAGVGLRAAAAEYGLAFVPLATERYFFAVRAADLATPRVARFIDVLRGAIFAKLARRLPGYDPADAGAVLTLGALASAPRAP